MAKAKKKACSRDVLVIGSKVKAFIRCNKMMCAGDTIPALSEKIYDLLEVAVTRAKENKRSTLRPRDL